LNSICSGKEMLLMNSYLWIKYLHELAAFWFIAGIVGRQLVRHLARQSGNINSFANLSGAAGRFETLMVIPGNLLVIVLGVLLAWLGGWPIFGFLQGAQANWLLLTNLILLAGLLLVPLVYVPKGKAFDQALQEALAAGEMTGRLKESLDDPVVKWAHIGEYAGLLVILALMVLKPI
jgi:uncharacterized membrane protein